MSDGRVRLRPVDFDPFVPAAARVAGLPLTEPQAEMWTAAVVSDEANCSYNQCFVFALDGPLATDSLRAALDQVVARHDGLRAVIDPEGAEQTIRGLFSLRVPVIDLSDQDEEPQLRELEAVIRRECETPFDLAEGPLVRATVIRQSANSHTLVFTAHHIVCDGWSSAVLFSDLGDLYRADRAGITPRLDSASPYRDYIVDQTSPAAADAMRADEEYWAAQYTNGVPVLDLPVIERPPVKTYRTEHCELRIDSELYAALKRTGSSSGATVYSVLLAAFEILLHRLSGQTDFVVGIALAGQPKLENPNLVAHCVSTVPVRANLDPARSIVDHVRSVRDELFGAQEHSSTTFGSLVRRLNVRRDASRTPLVSVMFTLDRVGSPFDFGDVTIRSISTPNAYSNFELGLNLVDNGHNIVIGM